MATLPTNLENANRICLLSSEYIVTMKLIKAEKAHNSSEYFVTMKLIKVEMAYKFRLGNNDTSVLDLNQNQNY